MARQVQVTSHEELIGLLLRPPTPGLEVRLAPGLRSRAELDGDGLRIRNERLLASLTHLRTLSLRRASLPTFAFLAAMPLLERVDLSATSIRSLEGLRKAKSLRELDISDTGVVDLIPLADLAHLERLDLSGTRVRDLEPLRGRRLSRLVLGGRGAWALPDLSPLAGVEILILRGAPRRLDLEPLRSLPLGALHLDGMVEPRLDALADHPTLERLVLTGSKVSLGSVRALLRRSGRLGVVLPDGRAVGRVVAFRPRPPDPRDYPCLVGAGSCAREGFGPRREPVFRFVMP
jgi:Leucine-rich repeat (LRR) protein